MAERLGVSRQTVRSRLRRYGNGGMADLADRSSRPDRCPHQTPAGLEATIVAMRRARRSRWSTTTRPVAGPGHAGPVLPPTTRVVGRDGAIDLTRHRYAVGRWLAGETVEVLFGDSLVEFSTGES